MRNIKILHFEDDKLLAEFYGKKLIEADFDYAYYESPVTLNYDPVTLVLKENPGIIIMSIFMPKMDGFKATKILKSDERTKNIPILGLTSFGRDLISIKNGINSGMFDFLVKADYPPAEVIKIINEYFKYPTSYKPKYSLTK